MSLSFSLAYAIDLAFYLSRVDIFPLFALPRMFTPLLAVALTLALSGQPILEGLRGYGFKWSPSCLKWAAVGLALPFMVYAVGVTYALALDLPIYNPAVLVFRSLGLTPPLDPYLLLAAFLALGALAGATLNAAVALGEEIGWRGLMLDELRLRVGFWTSAIAAGVVWALWHAPLILFFGYNYPEQRLLGLATYVALCVLWSVMMSILKLKSGSVVPSSVMHGTMNALAGLMLYTVLVNRLVGLPVGALSIAASATVLLAWLAAWRMRP